MIRPQYHRTAINIHLTVPCKRGKSGSILRADPIVVRGAIEVCKKIVHTAQRLVLAIEETAMGLSHLTRWLRQSSCLSLILPLLSLIHSATVSPSFGRYRRFD